jgi:MYXO-CTERM domain-containing protein
MASCPPGSDCPEPEPLPEPECSAPVIRSYCFPEPMACEDDAACDAGARCVALPNDWEDKDDAPMGWEGVSKACFPEGFARAIEGSVGIAGGGTSSDESATKGEDRGGDDGSAAPSGQASGADADESSSGSESDCTVATAGGQHEGLGWPYAFALAGLWLARRRRAAQVKRA